MAAATTSQAAKTFRTGTKQVFLPDAIITFLRPRENQGPNFATFRVPLHFNKLDLRDYLLHCYGVRTLGVRSQVRAQKPRMHEVRNVMYRPQSVKTMTAELAEPFVWPARPEGDEALEAWRPEQLRKRDARQRNQEAFQKQIEQTGMIPDRASMPQGAARLQLAREAARLRREGRWQSGQQAELDPKFDGVD